MKLITIIVLLSIAHHQSIGQITGIKISGDTCSNFTLDLQAIGTSNSPYFFWQFGDPASGINDSITITGLSASPFPTHTFTSPGIYTVCVSFQEPTMPVETICRTISIGLCCNGIISYTDSCLQNNIPFSINTGASINSISWNFGDMASGSNNISNSFNPSHQFSSIGTYTISAVVNATCGIFEDTSIISIFNCDIENCTGNIIYNDTCLSNQTSFQVNSIYPINSVSWNFDDTNSGVLNNSIGTATTHQFTSTNFYTVRAIVNLNCGIDTILKTLEIIPCDSIISRYCSLVIPNAFSPNNDDLNDSFKPSSTCEFEKYELSIYNRWGEQIFKSKNPNEIWSGDYKGLKCPIGVYSYLLKYKFSGKPNEIKKGDITLLK